MLDSTDISVPPSVESAIAPLLEALPLEQAMTQLVVDQPNEKLVKLVTEIVRNDAVGEQSPLAAGLWLYIDQLDRSHTISQSIDDATGSFWHGIMHRREGDFGNSHYWFRRVGAHPAITNIGGDYDPHAFIDQVEAAHRRQIENATLIHLQRREWAALFSWCATR